MSGWNVVSLILVAAIFAAAIVGTVYVANMVSGAIQNAKESLKAKGIQVTDHGVAVKTDKRVDRENYFDRTQAALVGSMKYTSVGNTDEKRRASSMHESDKGMLAPGDRPGLKPLRSHSSDNVTKRKK